MNRVWLIIFMRAIIFVRGDSFIFGHTEERHALCGCVDGGWEFVLFYVEGDGFVGAAIVVIIEMAEWVSYMNCGVVVGLII